MSEKKDITISNAAFTITIHWNGQIVATQACILAGVLLLKWISHNANVDVLCTVITWIDIISVLVVLFMGSSKEEEGTEKKADKPKQESKSSEQPAEKGDAKKNKKGSAHEENVSVKKRVPIPTQQATQTPTPVAQPVQQEVKPVETVKEEKPAETTQEIPNIEDMSEDQLKDLFNF